MNRISTRSNPGRTTHGRVLAGVIGAGTYAVGGGLLLTHLLLAGGWPTELPARDVSRGHTSGALAAPAADRGIAPLVMISVIDGPTLICSVPIGLVAADAIVLPAEEFFNMSRDLNCSPLHGTP